jgi:hypothetical protein
LVLREGEGGIEALDGDVHTRLLDTTTGAAFRMNLEFFKLLHQDVMIIAKKFMELEY